MPPARSRHGVVAGVHGQLEIEAVLVQDEPLFDPARERPVGAEVAGHVDPVLARALDRPRPVAHRAVDGVVARVLRQLVLAAAEHEPAVAGPARPWGHHERTEAVRAAGVVGLREQEIDVTDLQAIHPAAVLGIDGDARLASLELDHPATLRPVSCPVRARRGATGRAKPG